MHCENLESKVVACMLGKIDAAVLNVFYEAAGDQACFENLHFIKNWGNHHVHEQSQNSLFSKNSQHGNQKI